LPSSRKGFGEGAKRAVIHTKVVHGDQLAAYRKNSVWSDKRPE